MTTDKQIRRLARHLVRGHLNVASRYIGAFLAVEAIRAVSSPLIHPDFRYNFACHVARNSLEVYRNGKFSSANSGGE